MKTIQEMKKAIVLGNGISRLQVKLPKNVRTYGCNAIYRDNIVNDLVSVDPAMQHEIYGSGYARYHQCWFSSWSPVNSVHDYNNFKTILQENILDAAPAAPASVKRFKIIENDRVSESCIIAGQGDIYYITWLYDNDLVTPLPPATKSAGEIALELAANHHNIIFMIGFDGVGNVYRDTKNYYSYDGPYNEWYDGHEQIYKNNPNISFYRVNCKMKESMIPNCINITEEVFLSLANSE